jgi:RND superfamily putative drug exporter
MSLPGLFIRRGRSWIVAVLLILFAGTIIGLVPEQERDASPTDSLAAGYDSTRVVELAEQFPQADSSSALVLYTADSGTLTEAQLAAARASLLERLPAPSGESAPPTGGPPPGVGPVEGAPPGAGPAGPPPFPILSEDGTAAIGTIPVDAVTSEENSEFIATLRTELAAEAPDGVTVRTSACWPPPPPWSRSSCCSPTAAPSCG